MTDKEKFELAIENLNSVKNVLEEVIDNAYKDSSESYPDVEKGAYYTGKYAAYTYASCLVQQQIDYLNDLN